MCRFAVLGRGRVRLGHDTRGSVRRRDEGAGLGKGRLGSCERAQSAWSEVEGAIETRGLGAAQEERAQRESGCHFGCVLGYSEGFVVVRLVDWIERLTTLELCCPEVRFALLRLRIIADFRHGELGPSPHV